MTGDSDARTGRHDGSGPEGLRRLLDELPLPELERMLRGLLADRLREADLRGAFEAGLHLTEVLVRTGRFRAAFAANEQTRDLAARAPVGPWSRHAAEVQQLRLLHELGHDEEALPRIAELLLELLPDPASAVDGVAHRVDSGVDEVVSRDEVLEALVDAGRSTVVALRRWRDALYFSDLHLNLLDARRAAPVEVARAQLSRSAALREVGELDAADTVLLYCQEVFTDADDGPGLIRVLGGRGQVSWARGDREAAVALQLAALGAAYRHPDRHPVATAHRQLAGYLPASAAAQRLAHGLAAAVVHRLTDDETELDATVDDIVARAPGDDLLDAVSVGWLVAEVDRVEGVDFVALTAEFGLDADGVATVLAELVPLLRGRSAAGGRSAARALRRWEPAIATLVAAVDGDDQARRALDEYLALQEQSPECTRLVAALRAMADGVRDPGRLVTGLGDSDARIVGHASDALAGRTRLLATPTDLPAALYDARQRHRELVRTIAAAAHGRPAALTEVWRWLDAGAGLPGSGPLFAAVRTIVLNGLATSLGASAGRRADRRAARRAARRIDVRALTANLTGPQAALVRAVVDEIRLAPSTSPGAAETVALRVRAALDREPGLGPDELRGALEHGVAVDDVLRRVCRAVDRWVGEGAVEMAVSLLNVVVSQLLGRGDAASALAPAERLVELAVAGPPGGGRRQPPEVSAGRGRVAVEPIVPHLIRSTAFDAARRAYAGTSALVGHALPQRAPAPLGIDVPAAEVEQARRWVVLAHRLPTESEYARARLMLADAMVSSAGGNLDRALDRARTAQEMFTDGSGAHGEALVATTILAAVHRQRGELRAALAGYDRLVDAWGAAPDGQEILLAEAYTGRARVRATIGHHHRALADLQQALAVVRRVPGPKSTLAEGPIQAGMGNLYEELGDLPAAVEAYERAWSTAVRTGHRNSQAAALHTLGGFFGRLATGELGSVGSDEMLRLLDPLPSLGLPLDRIAVQGGARSVAMLLMRRAAALYRANNNEQGWARATNDLTHLMPPEQDAEVLDLLAEVLRVKESTGDRLDQATTLANLAGRLGSLGRVDEAVAAYRDSLAISRPAGHFDSAAAAAQSLARLYAARGELAEAEPLYAEAVDLIEASRQERPHDDRSRISYVRGRQGAYQGLVRCLLARGAVGEAYATVQRAKSRALVELVAVAEIRPTAPVDDRFAALLEAERRHLATLRDGTPGAAAVEALDRLRAGYDEMAGHDPGYVALRRASAATVDEIRHLIG
ncbi:tetratricopeptide repeat protein [Micromonospora sp. WMMD987]|uniref:tetratricopeptide repeat protein n=1 Tax=Micromonospora sp. WMMD987 TaxID=3016089 RepID=UPI00249B8790|nr:tetratricopeptide repeat protein [Micromonospora sp. WMMD987]WFE97502.1 tetratricopeptide repeat protein [Micromonospora sp. WMMD987]